MLKEAPSATEAGWELRGKNTYKIMVRQHSRCSLASTHTCKRIYMYTHAHVHTHASTLICTELASLDTTCLRQHRHEAHATRRQARVCLCTQAPSNVQ